MHPRAHATGAAPPGNDRLDAYTAVVPAEQLATIAKQGLDISDQTTVAEGSRSIW